MPEYRSTEIGFGIGSTALPRRERSACGALRANRPAAGECEFQTVFAFGCTEYLSRSTVLRIALSALALCCLGGGPTGARQPDAPLRVAAAADLTKAFTEVAADYRKQTGQEVKLVFASSGQLTQQIENGAPCDLFASANEDYVARLDRGGLVLPGTRRVYAIGHLVLWTRAEGPPCPARIEELTAPRFSHIAIANPDHAPYGIAAREALQTAKLWDAVRPKLVYGENIQATQQYAATGNAEVALLSLSLALGSKGHYHLIPDRLHQPLRQAMAVLKSSRQPGSARRFAAFVRSGEGAAILRRYGFVVPPDTPSH